MTRLTLLCCSVCFFFFSQSALAQLPQHIWFSQEQVAQLPMSGASWEYVNKKAQQALPVPNLSNQDDQANVILLAKLLVYLRTNNQTYHSEIKQATLQAINTENGGTTLAFGRELTTYLIAAQFINYSADEKTQFDNWVKQALNKDLSGRTLRSTHLERPNNWGTHAGAARMAIAIYLQDEAEFNDAVRVFRAWLGARDLHTGFKFRKTEYWQANPKKPVGINPKGATKQGHSIDGVLPEEQRRAGNFSWPPPQENYVYEGLQGALLQAMIVHNAYPDVFQWQDNALLRAFTWLHEQANYPAEGDDSWQPFVINHFYNANFPTPENAKPGKTIGYTDWLLQ